MPSRHPDPSLNALRQTGRDASNRPAPLCSSELFQGHTRIEIGHGGELYCSQITRQGKLILTK